MASASSCSRQKLDNSFVSSYTIKHITIHKQPRRKNVIKCLLFVFAFWSEKHHFEGGELRVELKPLGHLMHTQKIVSSADDNKKGAQNKREVKMYQRIN